MRLSRLIRFRRRKLQMAVKRTEETASSEFFNDQLSDVFSANNSELSPTKSGLTKLEANDRMKKDRVVYTVDQEGNFEKIAASKIKPRLDYHKKFIDFSYLNIGYYLLTPIIGGVFLGLGLDYWLGVKPVFFFVFLFLGTLASFYNIFKLLKER